MILNNKKEKNIFMPEGGGLGVKPELEKKKVVILSERERLEEHLRKMCSHPAYNGLPFDQVLRDRLAPKLPCLGGTIWGRNTIL